MSCILRERERETPVSSENHPFRRHSEPELRCLFPCYVALHVATDLNTVSQTSHFSHERLDQSLFFYLFSVLFSYLELQYRRNICVLLLQATRPVAIASTLIAIFTTSPSIALRCSQKPLAFLLCGAAVEESFFEDEECARLAHQTFS